MQGIVYITDETSRHEITSWKQAEAQGPAPPPLGGGLGGGGSASWHVVVIVDHSGSMRTCDVPGYPTRTAAVYDCLARDLVEPQVKLGNVGGKIEMSLIEMNEGSFTVFERSTPDQALLDYIKGCASRHARSHGNYLPALDLALELFYEDVGHSRHAFLVFLSDGAPSDHSCPYDEWKCAHGHPVWQPYGRRLARCPAFPSCTDTPLSERLEAACVERVRRIGDLLGRDRVHVHTVAFGPPDENYRVLQSMAKALPGGSFQKLGLSAGCLRTAFSSLTSSLTTLRTVAAGPGIKLTPRSDIGPQTQRQALAEYTQLVNGSGWDLYCGSRCVYKHKYDVQQRAFVDVGLFRTPKALELVRTYAASGIQIGVAHATRSFAQGAERVVHQFSEAFTLDGGRTAYCFGPRMVAKSTRFTEHLSNAAFHRTFCRTQAEAEDFAQLFNRRLGRGPEWQVRFLPCFVYALLDRNHRQFEVLVEEELEGQFTKWNDNAGGVQRAGGGGVGSQLGGIVEGDEEEDSDDDYYGEVSSAPREATVEEVPQCFSHFTFIHSGGRKLVCDLQGVWNSTDGFTLTDPVIHHHSGSKKNGATDKGQTGISNFFATHKCGPLCRRLGFAY
ncbi:hypothetical protein GPECTOR_3g439 [Gonium pectorale]|uniref:Alpha-type protein kinase domain-containing protein n=1 Tax=Gonium pectorale TaxID=33097 RepID=A0A150GZU7_GONPE|nr:hypothetical protein GPECTOR_3g439 [Gonium pectorale]|eukprot:KXZ55304.1 hypothetical protein GPECTOR_3g439 [Gonium pectorale]